MNVYTWKQFRKGRHEWRIPLLGELDKFKDPVLISGCQRSGTTMLYQIFTKSVGMMDYQFGKYGELDAALILSGKVSHQAKGRYCFQTTYLNECYPEYYTHSDYQMIWIIRNPLSVVYSMIKNWGRPALNELFSTCGASMLKGLDAKMFKLLRAHGVKNIKKACFAYAGKTSQIFEIKQHIDNKRLMIVDYDNLVKKKEIILPKLYEFIDLPFDASYLDNIHSNSLIKKKQLSDQSIFLIEDICMPVYRKASNLLTKFD